MRLGFPLYREPVPGCADRWEHVGSRAASPAQRRCVRGAVVAAYSRLRLAGQGRTMAAASTSRRKRVMAERVRIGIIGAGNFTTGRLLPGFQALPDVEITAVANRR